MSAKKQHREGTGSRPRRRWRPEVERDRSMRAYERNPRALREKASQ